jgi:hypothetical protein
LLESISSLLTSWTGQNNILLILQADKLQDSELKTLLAEQSRLKRAIKAEKENKASSGPLLRLPLTAYEIGDQKQPEDSHIDENDGPQTENQQSSANQSQTSTSSADQSEPGRPNCADQSGEEERREVCLRDMEEKLREIMLTMEVKRSQEGRPYDLLAMSLEQLCQEKAELQVLLIGEYPFTGILRIIFDFFGFRFLLFVISLSEA